MIKVVKPFGGQWWQAGAFLLLGLVLAACQSNPANCDATNAGSLFNASSCLSGGGFDARLAQIQAETRSILRDTQLTRAETDALWEERNRVIRERVSIDQQTRSLGGDLARLRLELSSVRASNAEDQARVQAMDEDLRQLENELAALEATADHRDPAAVEAEIAELREDIARRQAVYDELLATIVAE